jgi:predicted flavoprotein YhiN
VLASGIEVEPPNGDSKTLAKSSQSINKENFSSQRKSTFKEEFVTAGGIDLKKSISKPWKVNYMKTYILLVKL